MKIKEKLKKFWRKIRGKIKGLSRRESEGKFENFENFEKVENSAFSNEKKIQSKFSFFFIKNQKGEKWYFLKINHFIVL